MASEIPSSLEARTEDHYVEWRSKVAGAGLNADLDNELLLALKRVFEASEYVTLNCVRDPGLLIDLHQSGALRATLAPGEYSGGQYGYL